MNDNDLSLTIVCVAIIIYLLLVARRKRREKRFKEWRREGDFNESVWKAEMKKRDNEWY